MSRVSLKDGGPEITADLVIIATSQEPNAGLAAMAGLKMDADNGGIKTNPFMQTSDPDIFAAGAGASFPSWQLGEAIRVEHLAARQDQGSHAAFNMLGKM